MDTSLPTALIVGIDSFGAKELAIEMIDRGLVVIGVGDYVSGMNEYGNFDSKMYLDDVKEAVRYIIDFKGEEKCWEKARIDGAKLVLVEINDKEIPITREEAEGIDWRKIKLNGLFGQGMDRNSNKQTEFLVKAAEAAAKNNNLILPTKDGEVRLLSVKDGVEAIIRMVMMPGLGGEKVEIWGKEIKFEEIAEKLIDIAKMTRHKVIESGEEMERVNKDKVIEEWTKLRWEPEANWGKDIDVMLQYFLTKADEESRKPKIETSNPKQVTRIEQVEEERTRMVQEVVVEEEVVETAWEKTEAKIEAEPESEWDIEKIVIKNSNNRAVASEIKEIEEESVEERILPVVDEIKPKLKIKIPNFRVNLNNLRFLKWVGVFFLGLIIVVTMVNVVRGWMIYSGLKEAVSLIEKKEYDKSEILVKKQYQIINNWDSEISVWGWNNWETGRRLQNSLRLAKEVALMGTWGIEAARSGENLSKAIWEGKDIAWEREIELFSKSLEGLGEGMGRLEARMGGDWSWVPSRWRNKMNEYKKVIAKKRGVVLKGLKLVDIAPEILGTDGKRRDYLMLFQNENELRPSGGFIGSYGVVTFEGGRWMNLEVSDVYEADGQLKGHVEPPAPIKKYLGEGGWFLRDANWQADFRQAAGEILWFFEKETGRKVDGVVAINLSVAKAALEVTGEIFVPDFKEKVNADNLYEQAEFYAETKFFPGSTQKAGFLGMLARQIFEAIKTMDSGNKAKLAEAWMDKAEEREIQVNIINKEVAGVINSLGWDGAMMGGRCATTTAETGCFSDYLMIVEANLGVNKANYFLYRNIEQTVEISSNMITRVVKVNFENTSKNSNWPGGNYKAYTRIYIPESSNLAEVAVTDLRGGKTVFQTNDLDVGIVNGKKEIGLLLDIPFSSKRMLEIRYSEVINMSNKMNFSYMQYIQKQSGYGDTGVTVLLTLPEGWQVNQVEPAASVVSKGLLFNQKLNKDIKMGVEIGK